RHVQAVWHGPRTHDRARRGAIARRLADARRRDRRLCDGRRVARGPRGGRRMTSVLIVDDDVGFRTTIGRDLGEQGFTVALAHDAGDALEVLAAHSGDHAIDVLLTDLRMPGADGIDLLEKIRAVSPRTRAILMSGYATARDYQRAIECGAVRVLCKPFTSSEL